MPPDNSAGEPGAVPLGRIEALRAGIAHMSWFAASGEPLADGERADAASYLGGLGLNVTEISAVATWREAGAITSDPNWDQSWWDAEEAARLALLGRARTLFSETALMAALSRVTHSATEIVQGMAAVSAARLGDADPALIKVAAGAATQGCYQAALAEAAEAGPGHPFACKYQLFAAGRWPLALIGGVFYLL